MSFFRKFIVSAFALPFLFVTPSQGDASQVYQPIASYSQASQDQFVHLLLYGVLNKKDDGYYLEIGSAFPSSGNNTFVFEKARQWKGVSIDIDPEYQKSWSKERQNPLRIEDATKSDYSAMLHSFPYAIDYLSLDIDGGYDEVLQKLLHTDHIFKVITIEHDFYRFGEKYRESERKILSSLGYHLLCPDVTVLFEGREVDFEDWWIHPKAFPEEVFKKLVSLDLQKKSHSELIQIIQREWGLSK